MTLFTARSANSGPRTVSRRAHKGRLPPANTKKGCHRLECVCHCFHADAYPCTEQEILVGLQQLLL